MIEQECEAAAYKNAVKTHIYTEKKPGGLSWVLHPTYRFFEASHIFDISAPDGQDQVAYPLCLLKFMSNSLYWTMKGKDKHGAEYRLFGQISESVNKITTVYQVVADPFIRDSYYKKSIRFNMSYIQTHYGRKSVKLSDLEVALLGRLARLKGLPFSAKRRVYRCAVEDLSATAAAEVPGWRQPGGSR